MTTDSIAAARRYRKRPVVIEAIQYTGDNLRDVLAFIGNAPVRTDREVFKILTLEGTMEASPGDWIIKGVAGEFYPCKPDIFTATYEVCHD